jgi:hypothetical protein
VRTNCQKFSTVGDVGVYPESVVCSTQSLTSIVSIPAMSSLQRYKFAKAAS